MSIRIAQKNSSMPSGTNTNLIVSIFSVTFTNFLIACFLVTHSYQHFWVTRPVENTSLFPLSSAPITHK
jgi:hypothetical protein